MKTESKFVDVGEDPNASRAHPRKRVSLAALKPAPYNPPNRTTDEAIQDMADSLARYGQLNDIIVRSDNTIVMGHRRWAAAKKIGWKSLWAVVRDDLDMDVMYAEDFATARKMTSNDALSVWLRNPKAVPARIASWFDTMQKTLGRRMVERMQREGYGIQLYRRAKQVAKYVDWFDDAGYVTKIADWLMEYEMSGMVQQVMARGGSPALIRRAVDKGRKLTMSAALVDE